MSAKDGAMKGSVALVLDPEFGIRLEALAKEMPVWVISSQTNLHAVELARPQLEEGRVTTILTRPDEGPRALLARALYAIDEHHGRTSQSIPYSSLLVHGVSEQMLPSELISELGFKSIITTSEGFIAKKTNSSL